MADPRIGRRDQDVVRRMMQAAPPPELQERLRREQQRQELEQQRQRLLLEDQVRQAPVVPPLTMPARAMERAWEQARKALEEQLQHQQAVAPPRWGLVGPCKGTVTDGAGVPPQAAWAPVPGIYQVQGPEVASDVVVPAGPEVPERYRRPTMDDPLGQLQPHAYVQVLQAVHRLGEELTDAEVEEVVDRIMADPKYALPRLVDELVGEVVARRAPALPATLTATQLLGASMEDLETYGLAQQRRRVP